MKAMTLLFAGAALVATSGVAIAQQPGRGPAAEISREQAIARAEARFARLDANRDGRVTAQEMQQTRQTRRAARQGQMFDRIDTNRDGSISREEFSQRQAMRAERQANRGARRGQRAGQRAERRAGRIFEADGVITLAEFRSQALQRFERLDANRDGTVTVAERQETRQRMRQERQGRRQQRN